MSLPVLVEMGIGLAFLYLILSLMAAVVNEMILTLLDLRANKLWQTINSLIDDEGVRKLFYEKSIFPSFEVSDPGTDDEKPVRGSFPSYLDSKIFSTALITSVIGRAESLAQTTVEASALMRSVSVEDLRLAINSLPGDDNRIRTALQSLLATGVKDVEDFQNRVAYWFDGAMGRLSGEFKRFATRLSIIVGFALAFAVNADSFAVGLALGNDTSLRQAMVSSATEYLKDHPEYKPSSCRSDTGTGGADELSCQMKSVSDHARTLAPLPLGWSDEVMARQTAGLESWTSGAQVMWWMTKLLGFLATALAISLGAPFWFDVLQLFMKMRNTGAKPMDTTLPAGSRPR